jgi:transposase
MINMIYDEKFRSCAVAFKDGGHTFKQLHKIFGICSYTYYKWKKNKEITGYYTPKKEKVSRKRKIDPETLRLAVEKKPDAYLRELAEKFDCSTTAIHKRLKQLKITYKKRCLPIMKNPKKL